jgi:glutamine synthetase
MREGTAEKTGLELIDEAIMKLSKKHLEHMMIYGEGNKERMTGHHETASYDEFSFGRANRGRSVRIGNDTINNNRGYFEDRRPGSNCDPYLVTGKIFETCCL